MGPLLFWCEKVARGKCSGSRTSAATDETQCYQAQKKPPEQVCTKRCAIFPRTKARFSARWRQTLGFPCAVMWGRFCPQVVPYIFPHNNNNRWRLRVTANSSRRFKGVALAGGGAGEGGRGNPSSAPCHCQEKAISLWRQYAVRCGGDLLSPDFPKVPQTDRVTRVR